MKIMDVIVEDASKRVSWRDAICFADPNWENQKFNNRKAKNYTNIIFVIPKQLCGTKFDICDDLICQKICSKKLMNYFNTKFQFKS